jgi:hypothetical protein
VERGGIDRGGMGEGYENGYRIGREGVTWGVGNWVSGRWGEEVGTVGSGEGYGGVEWEVGSG